MRKAKMIVANLCIWLSRRLDDAQYILAGLGWNLIAKYATVAELVELAKEELARHRIELVPVASVTVPTALSGKPVDNGRPN